MENKLTVIKVIFAVVSLLLNIFGGNAYLDLLNRHEQTVSEKQQYQSALYVAQQDISRLNTDLAKEREQLRILQEKYNKAISTEGASMPVEIFPNNTSVEKPISTGMSLKFELSASSVYVKMVRVTKEGAALQIEGCEKPFITGVSTLPIDGKVAYLLRNTETFTMQVSTICCREGLVKCEDPDLDEVIIQSVNFDVDNQRATLKYQKHRVN